MLIAHISDLHVNRGSDFLADTLHHIVDEVNQLQPDLAIITGDLTDKGYEEEYADAKRILERLKAKKTEVLIGNHDARYTGYTHFKKYYGEPSKLVKHDEILLIKLDSTIMDIDQGYLAQHQLALLEQGLTTAENQELKPIIALHHHILPVPDAGYERSVIGNVGDALKTLVKRKPLLVLMGHRHRPWMWRFEGVTFIYAGAASTKKLRGYYHNTYNLIELQNEKTHAYLKEVGKPRKPLDQYVAEEITKTQ